MNEWIESSHHMCRHRHAHTHTHTHTHAQHRFITMSGTSQVFKYPWGSAFFAFESPNNLLTSASPAWIPNFSSSEHCVDLITFCPVLLLNISVWACFIMPNRLSVPAEKGPYLIFLLMFPFTSSAIFALTVGWDSTSNEMDPPRDKTFQLLLPALGPLSS